MKISKFNKFHKNRGIYENTIMEPVEDVTVDVGQPQSQAQMGTTTKPVTPTKPLTKPVQPGTQNPNQQPIVTPVKAQNQAQGRYSQAQPSRKSQQMPETTGTLSDLADLLEIEPTGSNVLNYNGMEIEQYSENGHFAVNGVDTKTSDVTKAKMYIDKLVADTKVKPQTPTKPIAPPMPKETQTPDQKPVVTPAKAQGSQMAQEPKMIGERRSNKKNSKNRVNELTENPYMKSGGMTNIGGGHTGDTKDLLAKSQEVSAMEPIDKYLHFINLLSNSKVDKNAVEMILQDCYNLLTKVV